ncbi:hypothetical protein B0H13DRAFT_1867932 [Mycena leptocephala]|nr:hypothetical protein B0H13DRAFT_1867932 [Mycena leptocephala]
MLADDLDKKAAADQEIMRPLKTELWMLNILTNGRAGTASTLESFEAIKIFLGLAFLRRRHFGGLTEAESVAHDVLQAERKLREGEMMGEGRQERFARADPFQRMLSAGNKVAWLLGTNGMEMAGAQSA